MGCVSLMNHLVENSNLKIRPYNNIRLNVSIIKYYYYLLTNVNYLNVRSFSNGVILIDLKINLSKYIAAKK